MQPSQCYLLSHLFQRNKDKLDSSDREGSKRDREEEEGCRSKPSRGGHSKDMCRGGDLTEKPCGRHRPGSSGECGVLVVFIFYTEKLK